MKTRLRIAAKHIIITIILVCNSAAIALTCWEQVKLNDKSEFEPSCIYRVLFETTNHPLRTLFTYVTAKRIGNLPEPAGNKLNVYVMSEDKTVIRVKTKNNLLKEWKIIKLEKNCPSLQPSNKNKQVSSKAKQNSPYSDKDHLDYVITCEHSGQSEVDVQF